MSQGNPMFGIHGSQGETMAPASAATPAPPPKVSASTRRESITQRAGHVPVADDGAELDPEIGAEDDPEEASPDQDRHDHDEDPVHGVLHAKDR